MAPSLANRSIASTNGGNSVFNSSPLLSEVGHAMNRYVNLKFVRGFVSCRVSISLHFTAEGAVAMEYCWCSLSTSKLVRKKIVITIRLSNFFFSFFFMTWVHFSIWDSLQKKLSVFFFRHRCAQRTDVDFYRRPTGLHIWLQPFSILA